MNKRINIYEVKAHLSKVIRQGQESGDPYTICKNNKPAVDIVMHKNAGFDPLKQDPKLNGAAVYLCDPLEFSEDRWAVWK